MKDDLLIHDAARCDFISVWIKQKASDDHNGTNAYINILFLT